MFYHLLALSCMEVLLQTLFTQLLDVLLFFFSDATLTCLGRLLCTELRHSNEKHHDNWTIWKRVKQVQPVPRQRFISVEFIAG